MGPESGGHSWWTGPRERRLTSRFKREGLNFPVLTLFGEEKKCDPKFVPDVKE